MKTKVVISTLYSFEPVIAGTVMLGANQLILLKDLTHSKQQKEAEERIIAALGDYVKIETVKTATYDIFQVSSDVVSLIDSFDDTTDIYLNVSAGRKTKSLGLMFAGYARSERINKIVYITKENKELITLPNIPFDVSEKHKKILSHFIDPKTQSLKEIYKSTGISRATLFLILKEFKRKGFLDENNNISTAGRIALL